MNILIGGDLVPTESNEHLFKSSNVEKLIGKELFDIWNNAKFKIFNLECPLFDGESPIKKAGPNLKAKEVCIEGLNALKPSVVCLANNHILDHGKAGYNRTIEVLRKYGINYVGVGENSKELIKSHIIEGEGKTIAIYACCETEFTGATNNAPGANLYDEFKTAEDIRKLKETCDYVIVLYHGAKEYYRYPSPRVQKLCRNLSDNGADLIVCQHSHCVGCMEKYNNSVIVYGQGNFIFDRQSNEFWNTGILINISIDKGMEIEAIPIVKNGEKIKLAKGKDAKHIIGDFNLRSEEIKKADFVEQQYKKFAKDNILYYLNIIMSRSFVTRIINKLLGHRLPNILFKEKQLLSILNIIECEAHRELFIQGLKERTGIYNKDE